ncbi:ribosome small subunit-dependent GTPase A [Mycoplasma procyoni]|uniref:ribosome small subunit-dependent GTPase A n=1 Tax=Mycoplasma procyoni TaxID=568784 RepID=UPI00197B2063|nr:ribosome small subunit-dependent GTPase A [Mycoplasma procyoni]MBN3534428.1 ribosome small subunit-dependent GTPase A [Mycoplasma procyoni]
MKGQVLRVISGFYDVLDQDNKEHRLRGSGKLRNANQSPVVGDWVLFDQQGLVLEVLERKNSFVRPKIANVDQVLVVMSIKEPNFSPLLLDKYLMIIESKRIKPIICITKVDLEPNYRDIVADYVKMGYEIFFLNHKDHTSDDLEKLKEVFKNKLSVFLGQSGVGKTTTINKLSNSDFETQEISKSLNRGKHTTRVTQIVEWNGGQLIDTPGFSSLEIEIDKYDLSRAFNIFDKYASGCKFRSCFHYQEKNEDCNIKEMVKRNIISIVRYENYISILKEKLGEKNAKN